MTFREVPCTLPQDVLDFDLSEQVKAFQTESQAEWLNNRQWQIDNRAAAVATLTTAAIKT